MFILLLFNSYPELTYTQVCQITQVPQHDLQLHLIPLIKCKVLTKTPAQASFGPEDRIAPNMSFQSSLIRNKIPVMVSKVHKEADSQRISGKVEDDRRYAVEAAIIKVMKARRTILHVALVTETTKLLASKFKPDPT